MDSFSMDSSGFMSLLNSQSSQTIDPDCSEMIRLSSQGSDDPATKERRKWTPKEDVVLISAWLNTSKDPVVGNEQKAGTFWSRIRDYYNSSPALAGMTPREITPIKLRWGRINDLVCKFVGCYEAALKGQASGQNENDVMKAAHDIFFNDYNIKFTLDHAWRELRHDQKWSSSFLGKEGGKENRQTAGEVEGSEEVSEARPPGVKAAKAGKRKRSAKDEENEQIKSLLELKERLNKQKIVERLLGKKEPLSETEMAVLNKLLQEML